MRQDAPSALGFRPDINGLRAVAVLAVIGYHFGLAPLSGGFVGVDIFFVISGYLMTGIILRRLDLQTFSLAAFYLNRVQRIVPALLVLVALMLAFGILFLLPDELSRLADQSWSALLFVSNLTYWRQVSYFDAGLDPRWLLHSWSLSLEWQFYLIYPLLLAALVRHLPHSALAPLLAAAAAASFAGMILLGQISPAAGFYLLPPRLWELLAGALVYLAPPLRGHLARVAEAAGLALILGSVVLISAEGWPGLFALAPVLGTALVILAARTSSPLTGNVAFRWIGLASYSLYLWHWPVVVWLGRAGLLDDWRWLGAGLVMTLVLGGLSWRFVERIGWSRKAAPRSDRSAKARPGKDAWAYLLGAGALLTASVAILKADGLPQRFSTEVQAIADAARRQEIAGTSACFSTGSFVPATCRLGAPAGPVVATLVGDSHADAQLAGLMAAPAEGSGAIAFSALVSCAPVLAAYPGEPEGRCRAFNATNLAPLAEPGTTPLILSASWVTYAGGPGPGGEQVAAKPGFSEAFLESACRLTAAGPTYAVLPTPHFPFSVTRELQRRLIADPGAPDIVISRAAHEQANRNVLLLLREAESRCGLRLLDPTPYLCRADICDGSRDHQPLYRDSHHLTRYGAELLAPMFRQALAITNPD